MKKGNKKTESDFRNELYEKIKSEFSGYTVCNCGKETNLLYQIIIDGNGDVKPKPDELKNPLRGSYAFQTDMLIKKKNIPIVAIEIKFLGITTHDILTYSTKAMKHKEIYPYLRYGLIAGNIEKIPNRFFIHNQGFDFAIALFYNENGTLKDNELESTIKLLKCQIKDAESLLSLLNTESGAKLFNRNVKVTS